MKWHAWLTLFLGLSLMAGFVLKIIYTSRTERLKECPIKTIIETKYLDRVATTTVDVPTYYQDPILKERLVGCIGEVERLGGELKAWKDNYYVCKNSQ